MKDPWKALSIHTGVIYVLIALNLKSDLKYVML